MRSSFSPTITVQAVLMVALIAQSRVSAQTIQTPVSVEPIVTIDPAAATTCDAGGCCANAGHDESCSPRAPIYIGGNCSNLTDCFHSICDFIDRPSCGRFWFTAEALVWWQRDPRVPVLVTTSPAGTPFGTAAVLGNPTTATLFGGGPIDQGAFAGTRLTAGGLFPNSETFGLEASGFVFGSLPTAFRARSDAAGNPPIGVPFLGAVTGQEAANMISFADAFAGRINVSLNSQLSSAEGGFIARADTCPDSRMIFLLGFRNVNLLEDLTVTQNTTVLGRGGILFNGAAAVLAPNGVVIRDAFATRNDFYGAQAGVRAGRDFGAWTVDIDGKLALGSMHEVVNIQGNSSLVTPQSVTATVPGGLFAVASNSGRFAKDVFAVVPEVELRLGYQLTPRLGVFVGGNFLLLSNVVRPGDQMDRTVNVNQVPTSFAFGTPGGPTRPVPEFNQTSYWALGINFGFKLSF